MSEGRRIQSALAVVANIAFAFLPCSTAFAQVTLSLPLEGYVRPGHYMPVEVSIARVDPKLVADLTLRGDGALTTMAATVKARPRIIVPWLILRDTLRNATWSLPDTSEHAIDLQLRPLRENDRLVAFTTASAEIAAPIFPGKTLIPLRLDPANPLPGPAVAWELLDALVVDLATFQRLNDRQIQTLLAAGTTLVVQNSAVPDAVWPWKKIADHWLLQPDPVPPSIAAVDEAAFSPTYDWRPGASADLRRQILLAAAAFCVLALAIVLLARRFAIPLMLVLAIGTVAAVWIWRANHSPIQQAGGVVAVLGDQGLLEDRWTYQTTSTAADASMEFDHLMHPVFFAESQPVASGMKLVCDSDGRPVSFVHRLQPDTRQAFYSRVIYPTRRPLPDLSPLASPLRDLVRARYLRAADKILGQLDAPEPWGTVVVQINRR